jgi:hypothetical protein
MLLLLWCSSWVVALFALLLFTHCHSSHVVTLPTLLLLVSLFLHCNSHTIFFTPLFSCHSIHVAPFALLLLCCNFALLLSRYSSSPIVTPLALLFFSPCCCFHATIPLSLLFSHSHAFQILINPSSIALLVLLLLFFLHYYSFRIVVIFCLFNMVLPLPLPCVNWSSKLWLEFKH